ncbi:MAG: family 78 glycoside hydrolase catalytic domain [Verrucomicrobiota bacterium]
MMTEITNFPASRRWNARWIWAENAPAQNAWVLFRAGCHCDNPTGTILFITADTRYRLYVNGNCLGDGPVQSQPYHQYYDEFALDDLLAEGANCIAILVHHQGVQKGTRGGLLCEVVDAEGNPLCSTGPDWRCRVGRAWRTDTFFSYWNRIGPFQEHLDLRKLPADWMQKEFDDADWAAPAVIADRGRTQPPAVMPWCRLVPRDIEHLREAITQPIAVDCVEECLDLGNRHRSEDLSISLSQAGRDVEWAVTEDVDALLQPDGRAVLCGSTKHLDGVTDGRYDPCLTLDFGRVVTGYAEITAHAPSGVRVEIGYAERLVDGRFNNSIEAQFADCVTCAEGENAFCPLVWRSFRYLRIRIKFAENPVRLGVQVRELTPPVEYRGAFKGDDKRLEDVFAISRRTLELCSLESLMDTPQREQAQWLGDVAAVTAPAILACFGDTTLGGKFLRQAAMNTQPTGLIANVSNVVPPSSNSDIPDYSLWWVIFLWRYYEYTGDERYLHECYPEMQRILRTHLERLNPDGLIEDMFGWVFIDWADVDRRGMCAPYNAIFAGACDAAAKIARTKGDSWSEKQYEAAAAGVRRAFDSTFITPDSGLVVDCVAEGRQSAKVSEHANAAAIAFDCVPEETAAEIIEKLFENPDGSVTEAQPFFMVVVLAALRRAGRRDLALTMIRDRWGRMLDRGQASCSEEWTVNGSWRSGKWSGFMRTLSHAWSACPAEFLIKDLAGIEIVEPGCTAVEVHPYQAPFPYSVVYPTPRGDLRIEWDGKTAAVDAPEGVRVIGDR